MLSCGAASCAQNSAMPENVSFFCNSRLWLKSFSMESAGRHRPNGALLRGARFSGDIVHTPALACIASRCSPVKGRDGWNVAPITNTFSSSMGTHARQFRVGSSPYGPVIVWNGIRCWLMRQYRWPSGASRPEPMHTP